MKVRVSVAVAILLFGQTAVSSAVVPATPLVVAGIDHIAPDGLEKVLTAFCQTNGCKVTRYAKESRWDLFTSDSLSPVTIGDASFFPPHRYYVETWGAKGKEYMSKDRIEALKKLLSDCGAKLTLKGDKK